MQLIHRANTAYREWAQRTPWVHRPLLYVLNAMIIAIGFGVIVHIPTQVLVVISHNAGSKLPDGHEVLLLTVGMQVIMVASLVLVTAVSAALAGLMRSLYRGGIYDNWWSLLGSFAAFASLFLYIGHVVRQITGSLATVGGDTPMMVTYLTAWLLLLGYAAKVPWDEFRDRCASHCDRNWDMRLYWDNAQAVRQRAAKLASSEAQVADQPPH